MLLCIFFGTGPGELIAPKRDYHGILEVMVELEFQPEICQKSVFLGLYASTWCTNFERQSPDQLKSGPTVIGRQSSHVARRGALRIRTLGHYVLS